MRTDSVQERMTAILLDSFRDHQVWDSAPELCRFVLAYARRPAGMIRARLLIATAKAYGRENTLELVDLTAATELFHLFALIHDDEIDALARPGVDTDPETDSRAIRVLAGDLVHAIAQATLRRVVTNQGFPAEIHALIEDIALKTISGQVFDIRFLENLHEGRSETGNTTVGDLDEAHATPNLEKLFSLYDMKTGYYSFVAPLRIGALCGAPVTAAVDRGALIRTGLALGRAFQLRDDLQDVFALHRRPAGTVQRWEYNLVHALDPTMHTPPSMEELHRLQRLAEPVLRDLARAAHREASQLSIPAPDRNKVLETAGTIPTAVTVEAPLLESAGGIE